MADLDGTKQVPGEPQEYLARTEPPELATQYEGKSESLNTIAWRQFRRHPLARFALAVLAILYVASAFADFLAPYPERYINTKTTFQPPNRVRIVDADGRLTRPYVYAMVKEIDMATFETIWTEDTSTKYPIELFVRRTGVRERYVPFPVNLIPVALRQAWGIKPQSTLHLFGVGDPTDKVKIHLWGSDDLGGDVFGKVLFGGRISLTIGIIASMVAILLGMTLGGLAGFYGGLLDELILRLVEAIDAIPQLFLLLALSAIFYPLGLPSSVVFPLIVVVLSFIGWGGIARTIRAQIHSLKEREFAL
ncbi:MAG: ABC transporter permease subunit, partial [Trueperaceae bacterium]